MARLIIMPQGGRLTDIAFDGWTIADTGDGMGLFLRKGELCIADVTGINGTDADSLVLALDAFMVGGDGNIVTTVTIMGCEERSLDIFDIAMFLRKQGELTS